MKYYELTSSITQSEAETAASVRATTRMIDDYQIQEKLVSNKLWLGKTTIELEIIDKPDIKVKFLDIHYWESNRPVATTLVISDLFKSLLSDFKLDTHAFYPAIVNYDIHKKPYAILHILNHSHEKLNFAQSQFEFYDVRTKVRSKKFETGEIQSITHMNELLAERPKFTLLRPLRACYYKELHILSSESKRVLINEDVKKAIEYSNLVGYNIVEFNDYEITTSD